MAGGASLPESSGSKKSVDFQLNLIPCIDLLSVLISFLLMTAVWTQVGKIDVQAEPTSEAEPTDPPKVEPVRLVVRVQVSGYSVQAQGEVRKVINRVAEAYDVTELQAQLKLLKTEFPDNEAIEIACDDHVPYQELVRAMDAALDQQLRKISVSGVDS